MMSFGCLYSANMSMILRILVLFCLFFTKTQSQRVLRQYIIEKDFFSGLKAGEFSVYDQTGRNLLYRLESQYAVTQTATFYAYPGKQMVASIQNVWSPWIYDAKIQIYDPIYNQWIPGTITQSFPGYRYRYNIQYGNRRLIAEHPAFSLTTNIRDEQQANYILARINKRLSSFLWSNKYDLEVYTNELPDLIYLLTLVAYDYSNIARVQSKQNGK